MCWAAWAVQSLQLQRDLTKEHQGIEHYCPGGCGAHFLRDRVPDYMGSSVLPAWTQLMVNILPTYLEYLSTVLGSIFVTAEF